MSPLCLQICFRPRSCDLELWPSDPKVYRFYALALLRGPRVPIVVVQSLSRYRVHKFDYRRTDGRTNGQVENVTPQLATLAWRRHKNKNSPFVVHSNLYTWLKCETYLRKRLNNQLTTKQAVYSRRVRPIRYAPAPSNPDLWSVDFETGIKVASGKPTFQIWAR